jgi:type IV fimbrial biogenesis protein FimT
MASMNKKIMHGNRSTAGLTMVELLLVVAVGMVMTAVAIPTTRSLMASYQLDAAAQSTAGTIQSTRYRAIMNGYPYQVDFNSTTNNFQLSSEVPPATTFSSVGGAVAISSSSVTLGVGTPNSSSAGHAIFQFNPNGTVSVTSGQAMPLALTIAYRGTTKHLTVSNYGSISVSTTTP